MLRPTPVRTGRMPRRSSMLLLWRRPSMSMLGALPRRTWSLAAEITPRPRPGKVSAKVSAARGRTPRGRRPTQSAAAIIRAIMRDTPARPARWHGPCNVGDGSSALEFQPCPLASITRIPERDAAGMRGTDGAGPRDRTRARLAAATAASGGAGGLLVAAALSRRPAWMLQGWASSDATVARERVRVATVTRGEFVSDVAAQATVVAAVSPALYAPAAGTVILAVKAGDTVQQGRRAGDARQSRRCATSTSASARRSRA